MRDVLSGSFALPRLTFWQSNRFRAITWNIDRGLQLEKIIDFLEAQRADVIALQEVDLNARRTGYRNIAENLAKRLRMNYVFGCEFQELAQGRRNAPAYHGQATLSCWPLSKSRVIRFHHQSNFWKPKWYLPRTEPFEQRLGGRIALLTEAEIFGRKLVFYNVHLESRGDRNIRLAQVSETVDDAGQYAANVPVILAGDLNLDLSRSILSASALERAGFHSAIELPPPHTTTPRGILRHRKTIDWVYLAGPIVSTSAGVSDDVSASDHYPIWFDLKFRGSP
jgi:endonuclease/exonuclease/phosphatase family metal-dependent hydrolase